MATNNSAVTSLTPIVDNSKKETLTEVKVTVIDGKETAVIALNETLAYFHKAFDLQDDYENESQFVKDMSLKASEMFLRTECARVIAKWDNIVTAATKTQRYKNVGRVKVEESLRDNPKTRGFYSAATKAAAIKAAL